MSRILLLVVGLSTVLAVWGEEPTLSAPSWLAPYPGAEVTTKKLSGVIEFSYSVSAKQPDVVAHYEQQFGARGLKFLTNADYAGIAIRASANECDLLVQIREQNSGTFTRVNCSAKSSTPSGAPVVEERRPNSSFPRRHSETSTALADAAAAHKQRLEGMRKFDNPLYPVSKDPNAMNLSWPGWLVHMRGADHPLSVKEGVDQSRHRYLQSEFHTTLPMTSLHQFYEDLLNSNGYPVSLSKLATGHTISGVIQNSDGYVEGTYYPYGIGKGAIEIRATFSRFYLNEPIDVRLRVTVVPPLPPLNPRR